MQKPQQNAKTPTKCKNHNKMQKPQQNAKTFKQQFEKEIQTDIVEEKNAAAKTDEDKKKFYNLKNFSNRVISVLVNIKGLTDENTVRVIDKKKVYMHFKDDLISIQQLSDAIFRKNNFLKNLKLIFVKVFDELFNEEVELIDRTQILSNHTNTFKFRQLTLPDFPAGFIHVLVIIKGLIKEDTGRVIDKKKVYMHFKDDHISIQQLIDAVFQRINLLKNYKLIYVKVFEKLFEKEVERIDMTEILSNDTYTFNVYKLKYLISFLSFLINKLICLGIELAKFISRRFIAVFSLLTELYCQQFA